MTTAYTSVLKLALPITGELSGTWGDVVNNNITSMVEEAITGLATISTWTGASHTLTTADGTTSESRCAILQCSGSPGAAAEVICPTATKIYIVKNSVSGGYAVTLKTSAGTGIAVPNGKVMWLYCDGTNVVDATTHLSSLTLASALPVASGGTGTTTSTGTGSVVLATSPTISSLTLGSPLTVPNGGTGVATITGLVKGNGTSAFTAAVAGTDYVSASSTDTLTNKTISVDSNTVSGIAASSFVLSNASGYIDGAASQKAIPTGDVVGTSDSQTLTSKTVSGVVINDGYTEEVFAITGNTPAISPTNGSIQTWSITANATPTAGTWAAGQSITLMVVASGGSYNVTWTSMPVTWVRAITPTIPTSGYAVATLWKVGTTIYGSYTGQVA
jgi:hypothetical protein